MGWNIFKKLKLPKIKLPNLTKLKSSSLGRILDTGLKMVGDIAVKNAPALLNFATTFMPAGGLLSQGMKLVAGQLGVSDEQINQVPALPEGVTPANEKTEQFIVSKGYQKWRGTSDRLAPQLAQTPDEMWKLVKDKFRSKGIQSLDLLEIKEMDESPLCQ